MVIIMALWRILIFVLEFTVHISSGDVIFVQNPMSWTKAKEYCKVNNMHLSCITNREVIDMLPDDFKDFWIGTYSTFSSWIRFEGYLQFLPDGEEFRVPKGDIYTCQLLCLTNLFVVEGDRCICFSTGDITDDRTRSFTAYRSGSLKDLLNDYQFNFETCHYVCPNTIPDNFTEPLEGMPWDCLSENQLLEICSSNDIIIKSCLSFKDYFTNHQHALQKLKCKVFEVYCVGGNCHSQGKGNGVGIITAVRISGLFKGVGLTSSTVSITQGSTLNNDNYIFSCYIGSLQMNNSMETVVFLEVTNCDSNHSFFCNTDNTDKNGLCELKPFATGRFINSDASGKSTTGQGDKITTERSTDIDPTTRNMEDIPTGGNTDTQHMSNDKEIVIGLVVTICILVFVIAGIFIVIYSTRTKAKLRKQNQSSNGSSFRNFAYESNPSNNTDSINQPNTYSSVYDYIREDEYATIQSDTKNGGTNNDARYPQYNKRLLPRPKHQTEQNSYYTGLDKSASNNVYDELEDSKKQYKDSQPRCNKPEEKSFDGNSKDESRDKSDSTQVNLNLQDDNYFTLEKETAMGMTSSVDNKHTRNDENDCYEKTRPVAHSNTNKKAQPLPDNYFILTNNLQDRDSQKPQKDHNYFILESESEKRNTENKSSHPLPDNYFLLEKTDTALSNAQKEELDQEGDYVDSAEGDYDHLNKKREKGSRDEVQGNLYAHTIQNSTGENTYDTAEGSKSVTCTDTSAYDTLSHV